jgi:molybdenum cofactor guanylyltransferase
MEAGPSSAAEIVPEAQGFVLAGGASSRMGTDKALVSLAGRPLIEHSLAILREAGLDASIAGARVSLANIAPVVADSAPGRGPLAGVCAALASTSAQRAVLLSVDLPLIPASLISYLLHHARITGAAVTLASANGFPQTFPAVISRGALPRLSAELEAGRTGCFSAFQSASVGLERPLSVLPVEYLAQAGQAVHPAGLPAALWFLNVNTPADLERAERLAQFRNSCVRTVTDK